MRSAEGLRDDVEPLTGYDPRTGAVRCCRCRPFAQRAATPFPRQRCNRLGRARAPPPRARADVPRRAAATQLLPRGPRPVPQRAVALAALLLATGVSLLVAGVVLGAKGTPNATPLTVLGAVAFIPVRA
jgi:hypothetical protein